MHYRQPSPAAIKGSAHPNYEKNQQQSVFSEAMSRVTLDNPQTLKQRVYAGSAFYRRSRLDENL